jgi:hypothetical protein
MLSGKDLLLSTNLLTGDLIHQFNSRLGYGTDRDRWIHRRLQDTELRDPCLNPFRGSKSVAGSRLGHSSLLISRPTATALQTPGRFILNGHEMK